MSIPFKLNLLKSVEIYQNLIEFDARFYARLKKTVRGNSQNFPGWEIEKKILYWAYLDHKHHGSPLLFKSLGSTKKYSKDAQKNNPEIRKELEIASARREDIKYTMNELENAGGAAVIFGNLYEKGLVTLVDDSYKPIQSVALATGAIFNERGFSWGRAIFHMYKFKEVKKQKYFSSFPGMKVYLKRKKFSYKVLKLKFLLWLGGFLFLGGATLLALNIIKALCQLFGS